MSKEIGSAHNNLFQNILGREDMARDFVRYYMPQEIVCDLGLDSLEVGKRVKHLPKGEETVRTTAEVLRKEGYDKGYDKGVVLGEQHGKLEATQEMLIDVAGERYGLLPSVLEAKIKSIKSITTLKNLARQVVKLDRMEDFERLVNKAVDH